MVNPSPLDILSTYWSEGNPAKNPLRDRFNEDLTWDSIVGNGYISEISPLLYYILKKTDTNHKIVSENFTKRLKDIYREFMAPNMLLHDELARVLKALQDAEVKVIVLKGAALAETVYGNIALRPMGDIDLLVSEEDLDRAKEVLLKLGFRKIEYHSLRDPLEEHPFHLRFINENKPGAILELHWGVARKPFDVEIIGLLQRAVAVRSNGIDTYVMCPDDLLPYLCWHTANHQFPRLLWLCDIAQVIKVYGQSINWDSVIERSEKWKIRRAVYYSLYLAKSVLGAQVPERVLSSLRPSRFGTKMFRFGMLNMDYEEGIMQTSNRFLIIAFKLLIIDRPKYRLFFFLKYIRSLVFPGVSYIKERYSISKSGLAKLYQFLHPFILMYESILWSLEIVKFGLGRKRLRG